MFTVNFYTLAERMPKHQESGIFYLRKGAFDHSYYDVVKDRVELVWEEVDEEGLSTGNSTCFFEKLTIPDNHKLLAILETTGDVLDEHTLWCSIKDLNNKIS